MENRVLKQLENQKKIIIMAYEDYEIRIKFDKSNIPNWALLRKGEHVLANADESVMVHDVLTELAGKIEPSLNVQERL